MFKYIGTEAQMAALKEENARLKDDLEQTKANLDFVAIMADVEIPGTDDEV